MPIEFEELQGSPREFRDFNGFRHVRKLICAWESRHRLLNEFLLGGGQLYPYDSSTLSRAREGVAIPFPGSAIDAKGISAPGAIVTYEKALITIVYLSPRPGDPEDDGAGQFIAERLEPSAEFLTLDHTRFRWGSGAGDHLNEQEAPGRLIKTLDYVFTRFDVDSIPGAALSLLGKVNNQILIANFLGVTFGTETLLFNPPSIERQVDTSGQMKMQIAYRFTYKPEGWNVFWRSKTRQYEQMFLAGDETPFDNYELGDFTVL